MCPVKSWQLENAPGAPHQQMGLLVASPLGHLRCRLSGQTDWSISWPITAFGMDSAIVRQT